MRYEETFQQSSASTDAPIHYFSVDVRPKRTEICPFSNENVLAQCVVQGYQCLRGSSFLPGVFLPFVCVYLQKLEEVLKGLKNQLNVQVRKKGFNLKNVSIISNNLLVYFAYTLTK